MLSFQGGILVPSYTAAKSGVAGITRALANELAEQHINVNAIAPGFIGTEMTQAMPEEAREARSDAIIATDARGAVELLNPVAEALTGWTEADARGKPLEAVFRIVSEETGETAEDPVARVLREGVVVGLANHTLLIARDGTRYLDYTSGIGVTNTGHCHPKVVAAACEQVGKVIHAQVNNYYHLPLLALTGLVWQAFSTASGIASVAWLKASLKTGATPGRLIMRGCSRTVAAATRIHRGDSLRNRSSRKPQRAYVNRMSPVHKKVAWTRPNSISPVTAQMAVIQIGNGKTHYTIGISAATGRAKMVYGTTENIKATSVDLDLES